MRPAAGSTAPPLPGPRASGSPSSSRASTSRSPAPARRARAALREAGAAERRRGDHVPGAFELPQAARVRGRDRAVRRDGLPRLRHPRRDAALRVHLVGGGARGHGGRRGDRRADGVRRADHRHRGAGAASGPAPAPTTRGAKRRRRRSRWRCCSAGSAGRQRGRRRVRSASPAWPANDEPRGRTGQAPRPRSGAADALSVRGRPRRRARVDRHLLAGARRRRRAGRAAAGVRQPARARHAGSPRGDRRAC